MAKANSLIWLWLSALVIIGDQFTKNLATAKLDYYQSLQVFPGLNMTLVHNTGAAFSFLSQACGWQRWFFTALATVVSIVLIVWIKKLESHERYTAVSLALILGGALGNLIDRVLYGHVIDFIQVYFGSYAYPAFNIADSAIFIGAAMLIIQALFAKNEEKTTMQDRRRWRWSCRWS